MTIAPWDYSRGQNPEDPGGMLDILRRQFGGGQQNSWDATVGEDLPYSPQLVQNSWDVELGNDAPATQAVLNQIKQSNAPPTAPVHKGLFGIKGTARDIFGVIGDALTKGNNYSQLRDRERKNDALQNFMNNPLEAVRNLSAAGFGDEAAKIWMEIQKNKREDEKAQASISGDKALERQRRVNTDRTIVDDSLGLILRAMPQFERDPSRYETYRDFIRNRLKVNGVQNAPELPEIYDKEALDALFGLSINPKDQLNADSQAAYRQSVLNQNEQRIGIQRENYNLRQSEANEDPVTGQFTTADGSIKFRTKSGRVIDSGEKAPPPKGSGRGRPSMFPPNPAEGLIIRNSSGTFRYNGTNWETYKGK